MITLLLQTVWFFLPAMTANMAPVCVRHSKVLMSFAYPLDGGHSVGGKRILGDHKTLSGLAIGIIVAMLTAFIQHILYQFPSIQSISLLSYQSVGFSIYLGFLLGVGALGGDAVKSFFKRQLNIASGKSWMPFDQIDLIVGAIIATWWLGALTIPHATLALIIVGIGSYVTSFIGVKLHIKKSL